MPTFAAVKEVVECAEIISVYPRQLKVSEPLN